MRNPKFSLIIICLISVYIVFVDSGYSSNLRGEIPLSEWIVGEWWAGNVRFTQGGRPVNVRVDFVDSNHLIYYLSDSPRDTDEELMTPARYEFVSADRIVLHSRAQEEWQLIRKDNRLIIDVGQTITLTRMPRLGRLLVLVSGILVGSLLLSRVASIGNNKVNDDNLADQPKRFSGVFNFSIGLSLMIFGCILSTLVHYVILYIYPANLYFFLLGNPWAELLIIEISLIILIINIKLIYTGRSRIVISRRHYLAVAFIGSSFAGIAIGLFLWALFSFIASSYMGGFYIF